MQQVLDRTQQSLAQAFASLDKNARRQKYLYYCTIGILIAIVLFAALLLGGLAAARHLDYRRSHVAQYVGTVAMVLQGEASFLRRTDLSVRYFREARGPEVAPAELLRQVRDSGVATAVGEATGQAFQILVPPATSAAWGKARPRELWRQMQIGAAMLATQQAFDLDHRAYMIGLTEDIGLLVPAASTAGGQSMPVTPDVVPFMRETLMREVRARTGHEVPAKGEQVWVGPMLDAVQGTRVMTLVSAAYVGDVPIALAAASIPAEDFLEDLMRPRDPALLLLVNADEQIIDVSPQPSESEMAAGFKDILALARGRHDDKLQYAPAGVMLAQTLPRGFGALVYYLPYRTLAAALVVELSAIAAVALLLIGAILLTARYWDRHLLRRGHAEARRALESETINHVVVSASPIGLCIVRQFDHIILTSNLLAEKLLERVAGSSLPASVTSGLRQDAQAAQAAESSPLASVAQCTVQAPPPRDGTGQAPQFLQVTYAPARYRDEDVLFCAIQDVTAQKALEAELRSAKLATETMMRVRSNFFASMSHEIRTPLNALLGNLELLARSPGLEAHASRLKALGMAADGLLRIVNDILDFSKIDAGSMKLIPAPFSPLDALESLALSCALSRADTAVPFRALLSPTLDVELTGDRARLVQVINNLLNNAFKFTASGRVTLHADLRPGTGPETWLLRCRVSDSGIGMPPELVARVFQPFVQGDEVTASRYGGTGLGLSICAKLCELMGGEIAVESVQGVGSAFTVTVPLTTGPGTRTSRPPPARDGSVLVVCPDVETGEHLEAWLNAAGWRSSCLPSIVAARENLRHNQPDAVVVSGDVERAAIATLGTVVRPVGIVWLTHDGPDTPCRHPDGVLEVTAFGHHALLTAVAMAAGCDLPTHDNAPPRAALPAPAAAAQGLTILVAEDNPLNQTLISEQLQVIGARAILAANGKQALALLEHMTVDAVLADIHMPVMNGEELLAAVRERHPGLPVLAFSAVTRNEQEDCWMRRGFHGYLGKPASLRELEQCLKAIVPRGTTAVETPALAAPSPNQQRYHALLLRQLQADLPALQDILAAREAGALGDWAHRAAGGFLIVRQMELVRQCRAVESLYETAPGWSDELAALGQTLYEMARDHAAEVGAETTTVAGGGEAGRAETGSTEASA